MDIHWDWAEFALRWGVSDVVFQTPSTLRVQLDTADNKTDAWAGRTMHDHTNCCASCEFWTVLPNSAAHQDTLLLLTFTSKVEERRTRHGYPPLGLRANDRLEPSPQMVDVMQFECLIELLVILLFWSSPVRPVVHRRHPLLSVEIGTSVDVLHTLLWGIFQGWILRALWLFVDFALPDTGRKAKSPIPKETVPRPTNAERFWCPIFEKKLGDHKVTRVGSVFNNLSGSHSARVLRLVAAETRQLLLFVSPPKRSASRALGRVGFARCWRRAAVCYTWRCFSATHVNCRTMGTARPWIVASPTTPKHRLLESE